MRREDNKNSSKRHFRSATRIFQVNGAWYFLTREGDEGPYPTQATAERETRRYTMEVTTLSGFQESRGAKQPAPPPSAQDRKVHELAEFAAPRSDRTLDMQERAQPRLDLILDLVEYDVPQAS